MFEKIWYDYVGPISLIAILAYGVYLLISRQ